MFYIAVAVSDAGRLTLSAAVVEAFARHTHESQLDLRLEYERVLRRRLVQNPRSVNTFFNGAHCPATYSCRSDEGTVINVVQAMSEKFLKELEDIRTK